MRPVCVFILILFLMGSRAGAQTLAQTLVPTHMTVEDCQKAAQDAWDHQHYDQAVQYYLMAVNMGVQRTVKEDIKACAEWLHQTPPTPVTPVPTTVPVKKTRHANGHHKPLAQPNLVAQLEASQQVSPVPQPVASAQVTPAPRAPSNPIGQINFGLSGDTWDSSYASTTGGTEIWTPLSVSVIPWRDAVVYVQGEFANGNYVNQGGAALNLTAVSDTTAGAQIGFKSFDINSMVNISFNIPTGNPGWETQTSASNVPEEFVDDRYQGRGFGISASYGLSLPWDGSKVGLQGGYMFAGDYNPNFNSAAPAEDLKIGDSFFVNANRVTPISASESQVIQASGYFFLPTAQNGQNLTWTGQNLNASYAWSDPTAFSFELGTQFYLPGQTWIGGAWSPDLGMAYGPRAYLNCSYTWGDFNLAGRFKFIFPNDYAFNSGDSLHPYDGGGYLAGLRPNFQFKMGDGMLLKLWASYDYINHLGGGVNAQGGAVNVTYDLWTLGSNYSIPF